MAHGKDAARDLRYGRRGGRWATNAGTAPNSLAYRLGDLQRARVRELRKGPATGTWPRESLALWHAIATEARELRAQGLPVSEVHERALEVDATAKAAGW